MEMIIDFPGGARVDAHFGKHTVKTDQPLQGGGEDSAPAPLELFLASIGTCAGIYVHSFCMQRNIPTDNIRIIQHIYRDSSTGLIGKISLDIQTPSDFPEKYLPSLIRSAELCAVKKHLEHPPQFEITANAVETV